MTRADRSRLAEEDLLAIAEYIALDNLSAAARWLDQIEKELLLLAKNPYIGQAVDDLRPGARRATHGKYLVFYEVRETGIGVLRVLHGARKIEDLL